MTDYVVRRVRPGDEMGIAKLQRHLWGTKPADNVRYLSWKYFDNPYIPEPIIFVATLAGEVVAMRGICGAAWEIPGIAGSAPAPTAADLVIHPNHRDKGLYQELNSCAFDALNEAGFPHILNLSANPQNYVAATLTQGWKAVGSLEILTRRTSTGDRAAKLIPHVASSGRLYALAHGAGWRSVAAPASVCESTHSLISTVPPGASALSYQSEWSARRIPNGWQQRSPHGGSHLAFAT